MPAAPERHSTEPPAHPLTPEQQRIVEWGEGPAVVIAGAGTGKTRVIVERVAHLLRTQPDLQPENLLVLTYNVKAAAELRERIGKAVGAATAARLTVSNFHSFCHRLLADNAAEAEMPASPDVLDGIGQYLVIRDLRPRLNLVYHTEWAYAEFVKFINRCETRDGAEARDGLGSDFGMVCSYGHGPGIWSDSEAGRSSGT